MIISKNLSKPFIAFLSICILGLSFQSIPTLAGDVVVGDGTAGSCTNTSLQSAIDGASSGDVIKFNCPANHQINISSQINITKNLAIDGSDITGLILDGGGSSRIFNVSTSTVAFQNLILQNGYASGVKQDAAGGAIYTASHTNYSIDNLKFYNNHAEGEGGGAVWGGWRSTGVINNSVFENNTTDADDETADGSDRGGGAVAVKSESTLTVNNSSFTGNSGPSGGAINVIWTNLEIYDSTFTNNSSLRNNKRGMGGAIYTDGASANDGGATSGTHTIKRSRFDGNQARKGGGGLFLYGYTGDQFILEDNLIINNSVILDGETSALGGGLRTQNVPATVTNTIFANNTAEGQGAGYWFKNELTMDKVSFIGNTVDNNQAVGRYGGGMTMNTEENVNVNRTNFINNQAGLGGAVWSGGNNATFSNSIFANNTAVSSAGYQQAGEQQNDDGNNYEWPELPDPNPNTNIHFPTMAGSTYLDPEFEAWSDPGDTTISHPCHQNNSLDKNAGAGGLCGNSANLNVNSASYLGGVGNDKANGVEILSDKSIVLAGKFYSLPTALNEYNYFSANAGSTGAILKLSPNGREVLAIARLGDSVDDIDIDQTTDEIYAIGSFGLAKLSNNLDNLIWSKTGGNVGKIDSSAIYSSGRRVAVAANGDVTILGNESDGGNGFNGLIGVYDSNGNNVNAGNFTIPVGNIGGGTYAETWEDVAIDSDTQQVFVVGKAQRCSQYQSAFLMAYSYASSDFGLQTWKSFTMWCSVATNSSNNLGSDARGKRVEFENGQLLFLGKADGGSNMYHKNPQNWQESQTNNVQIDRWNNGAGFGSGDLAYFARMDETTGQVEKGQFQFSSTGVNQAKSFTGSAVTNDENGNVFLAGSSNKDLPKRSDLKINNDNIGPRVNDESALIGVNADFDTRNLIASWTGANNAADSEIKDVSTRNGLTVIIGETDGEIITFQGLDQTKESDADVFFSSFGETTNPEETPSNELLITEINWAGSSASASDQWIELYNNTAGNLDLTDFVIENLGNTTIPNLTLTSGECSNLSLASGEVFLISKFEATSSQTLLNHTPDCVFADLELDVSGEELKIRNADAGLMEVVMS